MLASAEQLLSDLPNNKSQKTTTPPRPRTKQNHLKVSEGSRVLRREMGNPLRGAGLLQRFSSTERLLVHSVGHRDPTRSHTGQERSTLEFRATKATRNGRFEILEEKQLQRIGCTLCVDRMWGCLPPPKAHIAGGPQLGRAGQHPRSEEMNTCPMAW